MSETLFELPEEQEPQRRPGVGQPRLERPNRQQIAMRLAALEDLLPPEHLARVIWGLVEGLDLSGFYAQVQAVEGAAGRPAIDPAVLVALWLYATADGVGSARALDRLCREHLAYQWLCGGVGVNYHTLADFRVAHEGELDALLTQHVAALMAEGWVALDRTAQDGVRIRASAGSASFRRQARLEEFQAEAEAHVARLRTQAQAEDDDRLPRQRAAQERAARERLERVKAAAQAVGELAQRQAKDHKKQDKRKSPRASTTDAQARVLKMADGGYRPAYNAQMTVDTASRVIVGVDVINQVDQGQVAPMLDQLQSRYGRRPREHLVDGGFVAHDDLEQAAQQGVDVYAPLPAPRAPGQDPTQPRPQDGPGVQAWRARMQTAAAQTLYPLRAQTIEWANAGLRQRGLQQFGVRGLRKTRAVLLWFALVHNLLRWVSLRAQRAAAPAT